MAMTESVVLVRARDGKALYKAGKLMSRYATYNEEHTATETRSFDGDRVDLPQMLASLGSVETELRARRMRDEAEEERRREAERRRREEEEEDERRRQSSFNNDSFGGSSFDIGSSIGSFDIGGGGDFGGGGASGGW